ncbi:MAG: hypothetical protein N4A50_01145 [Vallitalea sp.]|nr:hypothetical protein [Vallitalea sp.]
MKKKHTKKVDTKYQVISVYKKEGKTFQEIMEKIVVGRLYDIHR